MTIHVFGIRHHGAGSARALEQALAELSPDVVVIEAPADAEETLRWAAHADMTPPVAMLIYAPDEPRRSAYYPLAVFSPEWRALTWAARRGVAVRLMDLPMSHAFAQQKLIDEELTKQLELQAELGAESATATPASNSENEPDAVENIAPPLLDLDESTSESRDGEGSDEHHDQENPSISELIRHDPIAVLARAAGHADPELWWEEQVERRTDATGLFEAITDAMRAVRDDVEHVTLDRDLLREAYMRKTLREIVKSGAQKIAVVCGAYHAPVLDEDAVAGKRAGLKNKDDNELLKNLPKIKTACTWIPWTHERLTFASGYGAGVHSPGWYATLWDHPDQPATWWLARTADLLRKSDLDASSASVIEAVRLADALAAMRELRSPGLAELNEATWVVLCHGETTPMNLIRRRLEIGDDLGQVPSETPSVPLVKDVEATQKTLRLKPSASIETKDLDLRNETDRARSRLLHRLTILGIPWGTVVGEGSRVSTFRESWQLQWQPEFTVALIEANVYGNTVENAATQRLTKTATETEELPTLTTALDQAVTAELGQAVPLVLARLQERAAVSADVRHLMEALPPLATVIRYGNVRGTRTDQVEPIAVGLFERAIVGLAAVCSSLDDDATGRMIGSMTGVGVALGTLGRPELSEQWHAALANLTERDDLHGRLRGWVVRQRLEAGRLDPEELDRLARRALSRSVEPLTATAWLSGLLTGSGMLLLQLERLWIVVDAWLVSLGEETFVEMVPLVRRAFADFSGPERRKMGDVVKSLPRDGATSARRGVTATAASRGVTSGVDAARAARVLPVLAELLGVTDFPK